MPQLSQITVTQECSRQVPVMFPARNQRNQTKTKPKYLLYMKEKWSQWRMAKIYQCVYVEAYRIKHEIL